MPDIKYLFSHSWTHTPYWVDLPYWAAYGEFWCSGNHNRQSNFPGPAIIFLNQHWKFFWKGICPIGHDQIEIQSECFIIWLAWGLKYTLYFELNCRVFRWELWKLLLLKCWMLSCWFLYQNWTKEIKQETKFQAKTLLISSPYSYIIFSSLLPMPSAVCHYENYFTINSMKSLTLSKSFHYP